MTECRSQKIKIAFIFGTRPETVKMFPVISEARRYPSWIDPVVILTAQHREMMDQMIHHFQIVPDIDLNIMRHGQSLSQINTRALLKLEKVLKENHSDLVMVQGDTTTTFSGALAAFYQKIKVGHIEAGLRTENKYYPFPEEMNRRLTTVLTDYHFTPTETTAQLLLREGIPEENIFISGNTVIDALQSMQDRHYQFNDSRLNAVLSRGKAILLVTMHRRENWGKPLENLCQALCQINRKFENLFIIFPVHKNPILRKVCLTRLGEEKNVILSEPLDYREMVNLMARSTLILTDSGGIQEEAPALGKPVLILRDETERPEVIKIGAAKLVGNETDTIIRETEKLLSNADDYGKMVTRQSPYGDGHAARRIIEYILFRYHYLDKRPDDFHFNPR